MPPRCQTDQKADDQYRQALGRDARLPQVVPVERKMVGLKFLALALSPSLVKVIDAGLHCDQRGHTDDDQADGP